ncbi:MAG: hypothetical protein JSR82_01935 [Verrucomicrobia bacterium]|nr:hypothetical protein [Verrucomicrobiota bacterium]
MASAPLHVVTCLFNPGGFRSKLRNYERFRARLAAQGVPLLTVECRFGDQPFELPPGDDVRQIRARDVMWQKERLLTVGIRALPPEVSKVAWVDADVLFERADWAFATAEALERFPVVQPFETVIRLPPGHGEFRGAGDGWHSFAAAYARDPHIALAGNFDAHGHTGFAWAGRRDWLERHGLFDACIAGSGDHMMAHAFIGDWESVCVQRIIGSANAHRACFARWSSALYGDIRARLGCVGGRLLHLWHGEMARRRYVVRNRELADFDFDPARDLQLADTGAWEWTESGRRMEAWARDYFAQRAEDEGLAEATDSANP